VSDDCSGAGSAIAEGTGRALAGTMDTAETMAARRANSRREIGEALLLFMGAPVQKMDTGRACSETIGLASERQLLALTLGDVIRQRRRSAWKPFLIHACKRLDLEFERLRVLSLDLHFRLQLLDEQVKASNFRTQLLYV